MHGGTISVTSQVGQGSRFTISLPWSVPTPAASLAAILTEPSSLKPEPYQKELTEAPTVQQGHNPLILIAEDEPMLITILTDFLEAKGYRVNVARNGVEALEKAREKPPDIILMDVQMPELDGLEVTRRLRKDADLAVTPIIALTALAMPGDREQCLEAGANEYMSKPIKLTRLAKLIESYLNQNPGQKEGLY
jgi:CheY-like chemotaxis protein